MNKLELIEKACVIRLGQIEIYKALVRELKKEIDSGDKIRIEAEERVYKQILDILIKEEM